MSGHVVEHCQKPHWKWRYRNRMWVCDCGKVWISEMFYSWGGGYRGWRQVGFTHDPLPVSIPDKPGEPTSL